MTLVKYISKTITNMFHVLYLDLKHLNHVESSFCSWFWVWRAGVDPSGSDEVVVSGPATCSVRRMASTSSVSKADNPRFTESALNSKPVNHIQGCVVQVWVYPCNISHLSAPLLSSHLPLMSRPLCLRLVRLGLRRSVYLRFDLGGLRDVLYLGFGFQGSG